MCSNEAYSRSEHVNNIFSSYSTCSLSSVCSVNSSPPLLSTALTPPAGRVAPCSSALRHQGAPHSKPPPEAPYRKASCAHARQLVFLSDARAKETRWATSSSIGVTPENSVRDPDPGQSRAKCVYCRCVRRSGSVLRCLWPKGLKNKWWKEHRMEAAPQLIWRWRMDAPC